jgi:hypothetical protein
MSSKDPEHMKGSSLVLCLDGHCPSVEDRMMKWATTRFLESSKASYDNVHAVHIIPPQDASSVDETMAASLGVPYTALVGDHSTKCDVEEIQDALIRRIRGNMTGCPATITTHVIESLYMDTSTVGALLCKKFAELDAAIVIMVKNTDRVEGVMQRMWAGSVTDYVLDHCSGHAVVVYPSG